MKLNKSTIIFIVGVIISVVCTWLFARHIEWGLIASSVKSANPAYIVFAISITLVAYLLRAMRWKSIALPVKDITLFNMVSAISIGFMANHILPARAGELVRTAIVAKREGVKITSVLTTVILERVFDLLGLIAFTVVILMIIPSPDGGTRLDVNDIGGVATQWDNHNIVDDSITHDDNVESGRVPFITRIKSWVGIVAGAGVAAIAILSVFVFAPTWSKTILHKLFSAFPDVVKDKLIEFLDSFISGLQILGNMKHVAWISALTIVIWVLSAVGVYLLAVAFDLGMPFTGSCLLIICLAFAIALPQAPGYIGVFHLAAQKTLETFGIDVVSSQSFAISLWAISIIPITIIGIAFLWREGLSFRDLSKLET